MNTPNNSGQRNAYKGNALDELMSKDIRHSILAMANAICANAEASGFTVYPEELLRAAAYHSESCTKYNANALDWAHALQTCRYAKAEGILPDTEAKQKAYIAITAIEDELGSNEYKKLVLEQSTLTRSHLQLPLEAMMCCAMGKILRIGLNWPHEMQVRRAHLYNSEQYRLQAKQRAKEMEQAAELIRKAGG